MSVVYGVKPRNREEVVNISTFVTDKSFLIRGQAIDHFNNEYILEWSNKQKIENFFESVYIGNEYASVKFDVVEVLWSSFSNHRNDFALVCVPKEKYSENVKLINNVLILYPTSQGGFIEISRNNQMKYMGFNLGE